ncbi:exo-alpha-sialidase [Roseovarius rhodophyticola]|uniref:Exo-alpha-sialidase n=1 Tax=Roseovarius rhodophyticola TaxID=3080827 RepID=A0ABZ2THP0_9RHOB|nr:exo-alpha-sialidase [Roseovarius sp. W115]MDV2929499.1 exo-alpha-sialidase [Roseovarius sp. W115]
MGTAQAVILCLAGLSLLLSAVAMRRDKAPVWRFAPPDEVPSQGTPRFETVFEYDITEGQAHAPSLVVTDKGFELLWFEGSAEAQADVDIYFARFERSGEGWVKTDQGTRIGRADLGAAMEPEQLVVTLGNTVENDARPGHVFATVVSVGGWAMASVADVQMGPQGPVWARKLNLSPFLNRSHLVKSPMVKFADGSHGLPAYFELGATHGTFVRFAKDGRVRDTARMSGEGKPIQPMVVPLTETHAVAFLRDFDPSGHVLKCETPDGGQTWTDAVPIDMANPSAPVAALSLGHGLILMAANDATTPDDRLSLLLSQDEGETFHFLKEVASQGAGARYPMLRTLPDGTILLTYSVGNKKGLRVLAFNSDWVAVQ